MSSIQKGEVKLEGDAWDKVSLEAKDLVKGTVIMARTSNLSWVEWLDLRDIWRYRCRCRCSQTVILNIYRHYGQFSTVSVLWSCGENLGFRSLPSIVLCARLVGLNRGHRTKSSLAGQEGCPACQEAGVFLSYRRGAWMKISKKPQGYPVSTTIFLPILSPSVEHGAARSCITSFTV